MSGLTKRIYRQDKIYFSIPDFYNYYNLNLNLLKLMKTCPDWFRDNVVIDSIYGTFPGCIWNGGRSQFGGSPLNNIQATVAGINGAGIQIRFTFTNKLITEESFLDNYGNTILQVANNGMNAVNVNNPAFAGYISRNYPSYQLIWSTTKGIKEVEEVNALSEDRLLVPPYAMNNTDAVTKFIHPENIELLCCETCIDNCPNRSYHYECIAKAQMLQPTEKFRCPHGCEQYFYYETIPHRNHHITYEDMVKRYLPIGINKFKISGRNDNVINVIERYVNYFPKDEFKDTVRNHLLINHFNGYG